MFDSDYHDLTNKTSLKIIGKFLSGTSDDIIKQAIIKNALNCLSSNNFGQEFKNIGGVRPSEYIINLLERICTNIKDGMSFELVIQNNFLKYLHNRIGTPLRETEIQFVAKSDIRPFKKGQLVIWEKKFDFYEIVMFLSNINEYECKCASTENEIFVEKIVHKDLIYHYSNSEVIKQDSKPNEPYLSMDYIIETYIL
jgi:hypothetical protein